MILTRETQEAINKFVTQTLEQKKISPEMVAAIAELIEAANT